MKKVIITVLALITLVSAVFADVTTATDTLEIKTTISEFCTIEFLSEDKGIETVNFGLTDTLKTVSASLWTNKVQGSFPIVKLEANPLAHDTVSSAYLEYTVNGTTVSDTSVVVSTDLYSGTTLNSLSADTYTKEIQIGIPMESRKNGIYGDYTGSIVVTVTTV